MNINHVKGVVATAILLKRALLIALSLAVCFSVSPGFALATTYGEGTYGGGKYNQGNMTTSEAGAPTCTDTQPGSAPWLYGATAKGPNFVLLQFTEANDPVSEYVIEYGTQPGTYQFGMGQIGGKGTTSYLVQSLSPNTMYYFRVRAGNGCAPGAWSGEISAKTLSRYTAYTSTSNLETEIVDTQVTKQPDDQCEPYTVVSGDTLQGIAQRRLGSPDRYMEIADLNKDQYPTLAINPSTLEVGWKLLIPCEGRKPSSSVEDRFESEVLTVNVKIKVIDEQDIPVEGASVTLHSTPREGTTDERGIALFENVEVGEHMAVIAYKGQTGEQKINVQADADVEEVSFTIQIKSVSPFLEPAVMFVIGGLSLALVSAIVVITRNRLKHRRENSTTL